MNPAMTSLILALLGLLGIAAFAVLNLVIQPKLFPNDMARAAAANASAGHILLGVVEAIVLLVGIMLLIAGCTMFGTWIGYS